MKDFFNNFSLWKRFTRDGQFYIKITESAAVSMRTGIIHTFEKWDKCRTVQGNLNIRGKEQ